MTWLKWLGAQDTSTNREAVIRRGAERFSKDFADDIQKLANE